MDINEMTDPELVSNALHLWANYIETGNVNLSATDAKQARRPFKALTTEQMEIVVRLRKLAERSSRRLL